MEYVRNALCNDFYSLCAFRYLYPLNELCDGCVEILIFPSDSWARTKRTLNHGIRIRMQDFNYNSAKRLFSDEKTVFIRFSHKKRWFVVCLLLIAVSFAVDVDGVRTWIFFSFSFIQEEDRSWTTEWGQPKLLKVLPLILIEHSPTI